MWQPSFWSLKPGVLGEPWWYFNTHEVWGLQRHRKQWTELILWMQCNRSWWGNLKKRDYFIQGRIRVKEGEIENNQTALLYVIAGIKSCISKMLAYFKAHVSGKEIDREGWTSLEMQLSEQLFKFHSVNRVWFLKMPVWSLVQECSKLRFLEGFAPDWEEVMGSLIWEWTEDAGPELQGIREAVSWMSWGQNANNKKAFTCLSL